MNAMNTGVGGFAYLMSGFRLIMQPGLRRFVIVPFILDILVFLLLFIVSLTLFIKWTDTILQGSIAHSSFLQAILYFIFCLVFLIVFIFTFIAMANILIAPFNSVLAERVAYRLTNTLPTETRSIWQTAWHSMLRQLQIVVYYLLGVIVIGLTIFIPIVHYATIIIWYLFTSWFLALTYLDYPTDNAGIALRDVRAWMRERRGLVLGFGLSISLVSFIPILNFVAIPAAVAGAVKMWIEENAK